MTTHEPLHEGMPVAERLLAESGEFLQHFGVEADPHTDPDAFRDTMNQLNPRFKGERVLKRQELEGDDTLWAPETVDVIKRSAENMGMLDYETPLEGHFDVVIVLAGARKSNLDRTRYAVKAIQEGGATVDRLVVAGSTLEVNEKDRSITDEYAQGARIEYDLCVGAAATVKAENPDLERDIETMRVDNPKARTQDVIEHVLTTLKAAGQLPEHARVAAVTTQLYTAQTALNLERIAKQFGITDIFTAGNPSDPDMVAKRTPATYLSEILRTLRAVANNIEADQAQ